jgi:hypothetical protein
VQGVTLANSSWAARVPIATAYVEQNHPIVLDDFEGLDHFRAALSTKPASHQPLIVTFEARGHAVYLGLADNLGFVHVTPVPDNPPYMITVGDPDRGGTIDFFLHGEHHTEIKARHLVPADAAWRAVREFLASGELSSSLRWEEV